ncbi:MAG: dehydrogenase E1 component subunit alpha/beta [Acidimicrobiia bacterium]|nr:dehydrogenase E1 component subunit alpha/beta [Acidimicrobiia bacterium]MDH5504799.1 dehydrogenase E1 component subunit alpha/beta [Acidimicrobiia bacterium]
MTLEAALRYPTMTDHHLDLGLTDDQILAIYRDIVMTRRIDERMFALNRQGRAPFVVSAAGHEAIQVASAHALDKEVDWLLPYYRDTGVAVAWGFTPLDMFLAVFSKQADITSAGRQLPNHWSDVSKRIFTQSSTIATQYPHAAGIAHALKLDERPGIVAVYGGEGSTSEGDWAEAMNYAGVQTLPMIVIIENNEYAISVPSTEEVGGSIAGRAAGYGITGIHVNGNDPLEVYRVVREAAARARSGGGTTLIEAHTYRYFAHTSDDDDRLYRSRQEVEMWRRKDPLETLKQYLIENRLLPEVLEAEIEANIQSEILAAVIEAEASPDPTDPYSHVYANPIEPSEAQTEIEPEVVGETVNLITAVNRAIHDVMAANDDTLVFGEDVANLKGGVFKATIGVTEKFGSDRCFNSPLAESVIIGVAVGMAAAGKRPMPEIQFADYIHPAFDQIVSEVSKVHYRSNGEWTVPMVIRTPFGGGIHGALYHSQSIEAYYAHVPGLKVVVPSTPADVKGLLAAAVADPDPVLFLEPKRLYRLAKGPYPEGDHIVPIGKAALRTIGTDVTIVTYGAMSHFAVEAAQELAGLGVSAEVIDLRSLRPLDWPTIGASIAKTGRALIVHEDSGFMGYGAELAAQIADKAFEHLDAPVRRYTAPEVPTFPYAEVLENMVLPNTAGIVAEAQALAKY